MNKLQQLKTQQGVKKPRGDTYALKRGGKIGITVRSLLTNSSIRLALGGSLCKLLSHQ